VGSGAQKTCNVSKTVQDTIIYDQGYYNGLIGSHVRAFDWYQNQRPRRTLNYGLPKVLSTPYYLRNG